MQIPKEIQEKIDELLAQNRRVIVAIDGRCAAGKTTLSAALERYYGAPVIHMDDFFLPPELRTPERYGEPGGNVHYERFLEEVVRPLKDWQPFAYRRFLCKTFTYDTEPVQVTPERLVIIEGSYSFHKAFGAYADLKIFLTVDEAEQKERIIRRGGDYEAFRTRWIPLEERYFTTQKPMEKADIILGC